MENGFPEEAAFWHLFDDTMSLLLPLKDDIVPELNVTATCSGGESMADKFDFCINGELQWSHEQQF